MVKRTPTLTAIVGMVLLMLLIISLTKLASSTDQSDNFSTYPEGAVGTGGNQKILRVATPKIDLQNDPPILRDIQNATLGFQKIYVLSMPNRSDKRDALVLAAYLSGLELEFIDGVDPVTIPEKSYPENWKFTENEPMGTLGCWRGHMNVYRKMIADRIQTAFIMEDDVDWDIMIKAQMTQVARGTRHIQQADPSHLSPYGDNWDLLSTGHCGMWNTIDEDQEYWVINDDPTVVPAEHRSWWRKPNLSPQLISGNRSRLILSPYHFTCFASYGISISGAARAVYDQAILPHAEAIDMGLGKMCRRHEYGFSMCLGTYPMVTGVHKQAGAVSRDSDRTSKKEGRPDRKHAYSESLVYPVRLNLGALLRGETIIPAQHPTRAMLKEIDFSALELPKGSPVFVRAEDYVKDDTEKVELKVLR